MNIRELIRNTTLAFQLAYLPSARLDAEVLLANFLQIDRMELLKEPGRLLTQQERDGFSSWVERRCQGEPVAYICGRKEFWSLPFEVNPQVLIPRPETELLVEETLAVVSAAAAIEILDLGTGSGAVAVALAHELKNARLTATDNSPAALNTAQRNARTNAVAGRITFLLGDLFSPLKGRFDIIVSNPPYIATDDLHLLPVGVRDYEPSLALDGGAAGLTVIKRIIDSALGFLQPGGWLLLEIGAGQRDEVAAFFGEAGFDEPFFRRDYAGHWRIARARMF